MGYSPSFSNFLHLFYFLKPYADFNFSWLKKQENIKERRNKGRDPKRPQELQGKTIPAGTNLSLWRRAMKLEVIDPESSRFFAFAPPFLSWCMGLTCWSRTWAPLWCISYQQRDQRRMLPSLSCLSYQLIEFSPFLCAWHHDTQELREQCWSLNKRQCRGVLTYHPMGRRAWEPALVG